MRFTRTKRNTLSLLWLLALTFSASATDSATPVDSQQACQRIAGKLSSVSLQECSQFNLQPTGYESVNGFPILLKEYPPLKKRRSRGRILLVGGTHGDELASISIVFKWMATLEKHHSGLFHWHIAPLMNPDGALIKKSTRTNANGVDLNRNFPAPAQALLPVSYWLKKTMGNKRRFPGDKPLSEPETRWLKQEIEQFKPDVIVAIHAPYDLVDYDAPNRANAPEKIGPLYKNLMGTYPGSLGNYAGIHLGIPVITMELPYAGIMPTKSQVSHLWTDLVRWLIANVDENRSPWHDHGPATKLTATKLPRPTPSIQ